MGVLLLTAAIAFTSHLREIVNRDTGFDRSHILLFDLHPGQSGYQGDRLQQFYVELQQRLSSVPGITAVGLAQTRPLMGGGYCDEMRIVGREKPVGTAMHHANGAFPDAMGVRIVQGRGFTEQEVNSRAKVAVVSEDFVREAGVPSPIGMRFEFEVGRGQKEFVEVVGGAASARYSDMMRTPNVVYPLDYRRESATIVLRTSIPPCSYFRR
jgi:hypothetical protein